MTIIDKVTLEGLEAGTKYKLVGWQMLKENKAELLIDGKKVENEYEFIADKENMEVEIVYTFNASALGGKNLVTFEELYDMSNPNEPIKVAEHKDIEDKGQTVSVKEVPKEPEPEKPVEPSKPNKPNKPDKFEIPNTSVKPDSPKTGDRTNLFSYIALLCTSSASLLGTLLWRKYRKF